MSKHNEQTIVEIERGLLATMMLRPSDCWSIDVPPEHFAVEAHGDILRMIRGLASESKPTDPLSVMDEFEKDGKTGLAHLAFSIGKDGLDTSFPAAYAHRISTAWRHRVARDIGKSLMESTDDKAVDQAIAQLMNLHSVEQKHEWNAKEATTAAFSELTRIYESGGKLPGITTGLSDVDDKLGGLHKGDMIVVGGRAAMGKTAFFLGLARTAAIAGHPVGVISGEQPVEQISLRMLSSDSRIDAKKFRTAQFEEEEWPKLYGSVEKNAALPMWFLDRSAPTMAEVVRVARRWKHKHGIQALYIDYLQRIIGEGDRKFEQVGFVARAIKNLARDLEIPIVVLAQVGRAVEGRAEKIPRMGDLSDSSEIEKEADQILMLYRPGYYDQSEPQDVARVIVEKNRHGPTGYIDVAWHGPTMNFGDADKGWGSAA